MFAFIPRDDHRMALRLRRQMMAVYSYFLVWAGTFVGMQLGLFADHTPHLLLFGLTLGINVVIFALIRSGFSTRWRDPALTVPQMMLGIVLITLLLNYSRELQGAMLAIYFMVMTFGVFALTRIQMILMSLFVLACYLAMVLWRWYFSDGGILFSITFGHFSILALGLFWFVYVGGYISNLQHRVRRQRTVLEQQRTHLEDTNRQLEGALGRLEEIAIRDPLTGLYNRRHFLERLEQELARAERTGQAFHVALIDLDRFKDINDRYGHNAGDEVLRRFADVARETLRKSDLMARYGGEEFIVLFPDGRVNDIVAVMDRLRNGFSALEYGEALRNSQVTLSAGIADWAPGETSDSLIDRADRALYQAKKDGRNRIETAPAR